MKLFLKKVSCFALIAMIPILGLFIMYLYWDPFKVLKSYKDYSNSSVITNRDYISTSMFLYNKGKYNYNSFIFGSSRTLAFRPQSWQKFLPPDAVPFMFDASRESIYGIYTKLKFLDSTKVPIKNVLIILCRDCSFSQSGNHEGHLFVKHPATSGESNWSFQANFLEAYYSPKFLFNFYSYKLLGHYHPFMSGYIEDRKIVFDTITNEISILGQENEILQNPNEYYTRRNSLFYERIGEKTDTTQRINEKHRFMLKEVTSILERNKTNYKVILSPLYEQVKFNQADLSILEAEFGDKLFDFSGKNSFTDYKTNYYETSHFRPIVGDSILKLIYSGATGR